MKRHKKSRAPEIDCSEDRSIPKPYAKSRLRRNIRAIAKYYEKIDGLNVLDYLYTGGFVCEVCCESDDRDFLVIKIVGNDMNDVRRVSMCRHCYKRVMRKIDQIKHKRIAKQARDSMRQTMEKFCDSIAGASQGKEDD